jgi:ATP-binding cassette subfamily B protein
VGFSYPGRTGAVLTSCTLRVDHGDAVLLTGGAGSGKSTLAWIAAGLRVPDRGVVLSAGGERGEPPPPSYRARVVAVPELDDNHVFAESLAWNLLLGRAWPPGARDLEEAEDVARSLGLGPLLDRMPNGLEEHVGETGWQLSHGERTRVHVARALLQRPDVLLVDESLEPLDPETWRDALDAMRAHVSALVLIGHPRA